MSVHRIVWAVTLAATTVVGALGTMAALAPERAIATTLTTGAFGAILGYAWSENLPEVRHPVLTGAALTGWPALVLPGLVHLLGPWGLAVSAALIAGSPYVTRCAVRGLHRAARLLESSDIERAAEADRDDALRRQWMVSTAQLEAAATHEDRLVIVEVRSQILDDLWERWGSHLPRYVWASLHDRSDHGGHKPGAEQER